MILNLGDLLDGAQGECTIQIEGDRHRLMNVKSMKAEFEKKQTKKRVLGSTTEQTKSVGMSYKASGTFYYVTSLFRELIYRYQETGEDFYFDMTITNHDKSSKAGRQTVTLKRCNVDSGIIAALDVDSEEGLEEDMSFTFERFELPEKFKKLVGMEI